MAKAIEATVLSVSPPVARSVSVLYVREDGERGSALVERGEYAIGYWPPAPGDVIQVSANSARLLLRRRS